MAVNPFAVVVLVVMLAAAYVPGGGEAASLTKIDCTKCRLDIYSFGSKDYDCGIARHTKLPICAVECKILYDMTIPIPNLTLDFDPKACVPSSPLSTTTPPSTAPTVPTAAVAATTTPTMTTVTSAKV